MKKQLGPRDIIFPVPAALVVSGASERANIVTVAWIGMMASDPPILAISLRDQRYSLGTIRKEKQFTVNIPPAAFFRETDYCGLVSGRNRRKFAECGLTPIPASVVETFLIEECPFNLECKVVNEVQFGDWIVTFGEIVETHVDADKIDDATGRLDYLQARPPGLLRDNQRVLEPGQAPRFRLQRREGSGKKIEARELPAKRRLCELNLHKSTSSR